MRVAHSFALRSTRAPRNVGRREGERHMSKYSLHARERRAAQTDRMREIESAWMRSLPAETAQAFTRSVEAARARAPEGRHPDMAPGTLPRPPRPGHEPRPPKDQNQRPRRWG